MSQQRPSETGAGRGTGQFIEKGWTVYDAVGRPIGNVTEVDMSRDVLAIDGRAEGGGIFEAPLSIVESAGGNEVRLTKVADPDTIALEGPPRFVDPPATATASTARPRPPSRTETPSPMTSASTRSPVTDTSTTPAGSDTMREFTPPYASRHPTMGADGVTPSWTGEEESGWSASKIALGGLALGGLAAATYFMRRRMRRKTAFERFMDATGGYYDAASEFARDRHPAWWVSLAAAALPLVYYAWPSSKPTYTEQARSRADDFTSYLAGLAGALPSMPGSRPSMTDRVRSRVPSVSDFELPSNWHVPMPAAWTGMSSRSSAWDWSPRPDRAGTIGALAAGALAIYLIRRASAKPQASARIGDVMTRQPRVIQPDATVADAAAMMRRLDVGALPVCDGTRLIGMLTDRDITVRSTADGRDPHLTPVRDVMSSGVAWANEDDPVEEAARIMREHRIRRLPIVDERHSLVGVVSLGDLAVDVGDDDLSGDTLEQISEKSRPARDR